MLGPRINAGGRIGDAGLGARLLATADEMEAARIAVLLDKLNRERKAIETQMLEEAVARAEQLIEADPDVPLLLVGADGWHKGVVGLVASRLTDRFHRPSCVIAWNEASEGTGSLRSIAGVDIGTAVRAAVAAGHLTKGGGHRHGGGPDRGARTARRACKIFLAERLARAAGAARAAVSLDIDGALTPATVTDELFDLLERAGPYGQGNPQPRFVFPAHRVKFAKVVGEKHVRCVLEAGDGSRLDAVAFRAADQAVGDGAPLFLRPAAAHRRPAAPRHLERPREARAPHRGRGRPAPPALTRPATCLASVNLTISGRPRPAPDRSLRLSVRTSDFQSEKTGSTPVGSASFSGSP